MRLNQNRNESAHFHHDWNERNGKYPKKYDSITTPSIQPRKIDQTMIHHNRPRLHRNRYATTLTPINNRKSFVNQEFSQVKSFFRKQNDSK